MHYIKRLIYDKRDDIPIGCSRSLFYDRKHFSETYLASDWTLRNFGTPPDVIDDVLMHMSPMWAMTSCIQLIFSDQWISLEFHTDEEENRVRIVEKHIARCDIAKPPPPRVEREHWTQRFSNFIMKIL